jgi:FKBP-type peptidyl-prolyl cis-trans isomerase FklB
MRRLFPAAALLLACVPAAAQEGQLPPPDATAPANGALASGADERAAAPAVDDDQQFNAQAGYCIGLDLGKRLRDDDAPVDLAAIVAGLRDGLTSAKPQMTTQQVDAVMERFQQVMQQKAQQKMVQAADVNLARGQKFLDENRKKEGVQETDSGLQYRVLTAGKGATPGPDDTVRCHYEGKLVSGEVFDSSYKRGEPAEFPVGGVIAGWTEALQMMKTGSKWEVVLPASIAYGKRGAPGAIGPNETLVFQIELLDVVE